MTQHSSGPFPPPPPPPPAPPQSTWPPHRPTSPAPGFLPPPPPPPQVVHVTARTGGFARAVLFMLAIFLFGATFVAGLTTGLATMFFGAEYESVVLHDTYRPGGAATLAIVPIIGEIDGGQALFVRDAVNDVLDDASVEAVVLRVDSPGGEVAASDQIWYEINRLKRAGLPVVASYGGMAASGGYYVSCAADHIVAEETCITGSIGVIAQVITFGGLMEKTGVEPVTLVASGSPEKDAANDTFRPWTDRDKAKLRVMLDAAYDTFNKRVRDGRKHVISDAEQINKLADGSIYTASQAKASGLIDSIGYLDDAIAVAEQRAGLPSGRASVVMVTSPPPLFLFGGLMAKAEATRNRDTAELAWDGETIRGILNDLSAPRVLYLMH